jgi:ubiquinone/menaquinone biosynthesis C-methylase UbiE
MEKLTEPAKLKAATTYNAAADHFDDGPLAFWDRYGRGTVERLRLKPGSVILDVGCGSGASAIPAGKAVGPNGRVIGADLAERLLAMARAKAAAQKLQNIEFRQADLEELGYPDESFDAVICVFAIFFVPTWSSRSVSCGAWYDPAVNSLSRPGDRACSSRAQPHGGRR